MKTMKTGANKFAGISPSKKALWGKTKNILDQGQSKLDQTNAQVFGGKKRITQPVRKQETLDISSQYESNP